ncbi:MULTISPECIES: outer membrane protein [unclassified Bradyrhizobium]|uniref:outer membrane protein n=1 Tax=unclassified Bradyrhizobium TaxID=2631580 RepID=UPI0028E47989|nr:MULTISPECIES: outer membrane beta-barrel protein [unclassified Bradyrhizobium]
MKKMLFLTASFAAVGIAPAFAADLAARSYTKAPPAYVTPLPTWAGFYIGANGGADWSHNCWTLNNVAGVPLAVTQPEGCHNATSGVVGGQIGYRWQAASWVFGLEAQGDWTDLKSSNVSTAALAAGVTNQTKTDAIGLFTGQVGYAWGNVLWYVKGGAAVTHNKYRGLATLTGAEIDSASETRWGGTVGTGLEYGFAPNWSVALEYDHLFMGSRNVSFPATAVANARTDTIKQDVDMATVRVNYRFGGPALTRY